MHSNPGKSVGLFIKYKFLHLPKTAWEQKWGATLIHICNLGF